MKDKTEKKLRLSLHRILSGRPTVISKSRKLSIASVAQEAGVSSALIHNRYPNIADEIRSKCGRAYKTRVVDKVNEVSKLRQTNRELRAELKLYKDQLRNLASINLAQEHRLRVLEAMVETKKIEILPSFNS